jgi:hypothetical protein
MYRPTQQILADDRIRTMRREAEAERLVAQARQASKAPPKDRPRERRDRFGVPFGFLRRLVDRLVAA